MNHIEVADRPILMSRDMVNATLADLKTNTRRITKPQPGIQRDMFPTSLEDFTHDGKSKKCVLTIEERPGVTRCLGSKNFIEEFSPFKVGGRLWVKEAHFKYGHWVKDGLTKTGKHKWSFNAFPGKPVKFPDDPPNIVRKNSFRFDGWYKRNSLFMCKADARIWLEITDVRIERLHQISKEDAVAEGLPPCLGLSVCGGGPSMCQSCPSENPVLWFSSLWETINGPGSWSLNPWVWVIVFKKVKR